AGVGRKQPVVPPSPSQGRGTSAEPMFAPRSGRGVRGFSLFFGSQLAHSIDVTCGRSSMAAFNGLGMGLGNLAPLSQAQTRSITPENVDGAKGRGGMATEGTGAEAARDLGQGWKVSPSIRIAPGASATIAEIAGSGAIQQIWITTHYVNWRRLVLRFFWDND